MSIPSIHANIWNKSVSIQSREETLYQRRMKQALLFSKIQNLKMQFQLEQEELDKEEKDIEIEKLRSKSLWNVGPKDTEGVCSKTPSFQGNFGSMVFEYPEKKDMSHLPSYPFAKQVSSGSFGSFKGDERKGAFATQRMEPEDFRKKKNHDLDHKTPTRFVAFNNLPAQVTWDDVKKVVCGAGFTGIHESIYVGTHKKRSKCPNYALITFKDVETAISFVERTKFKMWFYGYQTRINFNPHGAERHGFKNRLFR